MEWLFDPIRIAVSNNNAVEALKLLQQGADPNLITPQRQPLLHCAVKQRSIVMTQLLLQFGANPNACGPVGDTALHHACTGPTEAAHQITFDLCRQGANPLAKDFNGVTPLDLAYQKKDGVLVNMFSNILGKLTGGCVNRSRRKEMKIRQRRKVKPDEVQKQDDIPEEGKQDVNAEVAKQDVELKPHQKEVILLAKRGILEKQDANVLDESNKKDCILTKNKFIKKTTSTKRICEANGECQNKSSKRNHDQSVRATSMIHEENKISKTNYLPFNKPHNAWKENLPLLKNPKTAKKENSSNKSGVKRQGHRRRMQPHRPFTPLKEYNLFATKNSPDKDNLDAKSSCSREPQAKNHPARLPPLPFCPSDGLYPPPDQHFLKSILSTSPDMGIFDNLTPAPEWVHGSRAFGNTWLNGVSPLDCEWWNLSGSYEQFALISERPSNEFPKACTDAYQISPIETYLNDIIFAYAKVLKGSFLTFYILRFCGMEEEFVNFQEIILKKMSVTEARRNYSKVEKMLDCISETMAAEIQAFSSTMNLWSETVSRLANKVIQDSIRILEAAEVAAQVVETEIHEHEDVQWQTYLGEHISSLERTSELAAQQLFCAHEKLLLSLVKHRIGTCELEAMPKRTALQLIGEITACVHHNRSIIVRGFTYKHPSDFRRKYHHA